MPHDGSILRDIALAIVFAVACAHIARLIRLPLILAYIAGGVLLGPSIGFGLVASNESIDLISEMGLMLLMFIIGLEIDVRELKRLGRSMVALGAAQFATSVMLGLVFFDWLGYSDTGRFDLVYLAIVTSLSSTLIVVKLLHDKFELKLLSGRLTLAVLVFQDLVAITFMALQPNLADPGLIPIARSIAAGLLLVAFAFMVSRYALAPLFEAVAKWPELVLLSSVAWCFVMSGIAEWLGISREMGALITGVSIAAFPYSSDVISKITGVRDFFVTLFFVALGMKVATPSAAVLGYAVLIVGFVFVTRLVGVVPAVFLLGHGPYTGIITAVNLAQISEFSLVILALGAQHGHVSGEVANLVLTAMILTSLVSTYAIGANEYLARVILRPFRGDLAHDAARAISEGDGGEVRDLVLLGHFRIAEAILDLVEARAPELKPRIMLVDYNAVGARRVRERGFGWRYADLGNPASLGHIGLTHARVIVTTISDTFLKGTTTRRLVANLRRLAPDAVIIMTGEEKTDAAELLGGGADHVLIPGEITGERALEALLKASLPRSP